MSDNPGEPVSIEEGSGQQDQNEPIQRTDETDRNKDGNVENNKSQEGGNAVELENNENINNRKRKRRNEEEETIGKKKKEIYLCGVCNENVNKGSVKCNGCEKWIHRRYFKKFKNRPNCSGLKRSDVYEDGVYRCPNCADPTKSPKKPGRPKLTKSLKTGSQRRYGNLVSKRKANEEIKSIENWVEYQKKNNMKTDERDKVDKMKVATKIKMEIKRVLYHVVVQI